MDSRTVFSDSNDIISGGSSSISCVATNTEPFSPDVTALKRLSESLASVFESPTDFNFFSDAKIAVGDGREVPVHRCILSVRSPFFRSFFSGKEENVKLELKELLAKDLEIRFDSVVSVLGYLYSGKVRALPKGVCVCADDGCEHIACRPAVDYMVEILYTSFVFQISELVSLYQKQLLDILEKATADDILVILSVANKCGKACEELLARCIDIIVRSDVDFVTLDRGLPEQIVKQIIDSRFDLGLDEPGSSSFPDKHVKRIHRALDSDDVELVRMLLKEDHTTLDNACALHYAVAYGDAKTTTELLDLAIADVNHRNLRGYTVLHVAAMRKEPKIIVSLLTKGARPSELTPDGRKALQIAKRLTRSADYYKSTDEGKASPKDRLCVEILEQAERRAPLLGEAAVSLAMAGDDLRMNLLYLENRVGLAKLLFPMEAQVAMDIAQVDGTSEFHLASLHPKNSASTRRRTMDLNDAPFVIKEEHLNRLKALSKTVELGKRFFPRCSEVLNKIMDSDDFPELVYLGEDTDDKRQVKKQRQMELQEVLTKAFSEDKQEFDRSSNISSSSSSNSLAPVKPNGSSFTFKM